MNYAPRAGSLTQPAELQSSTLQSLPLCPGYPILANDEESILSLTEPHVRIRRVVAVLCAALPCAVHPAAGPSATGTRVRHVGILVLPAQLRRHALLRGLIEVEHSG